MEEEQQAGGPPPAPSVPAEAIKAVRKQTKSMHNLLVIDGNPNNNWYAVFKGLKGPDGEDIKVGNAHRHNSQSITICLANLIHNHF